MTPLTPQPNEETTMRLHLLRRVPVTLATGIGAVLLGTLQVFLLAPPGALGL